VIVDILDSMVDGYVVDSEVGDDEADSMVDDSMVDDNMVGDSMVGDNTVDSMVHLYLMNYTLVHHLYPLISSYF